MTTLTPLETLEREISAQRNGLSNAIVCRREHPSYGYTKRDILERLAVLEGMLAAHRIVITGQGTAALHLAALDSATAMGIDLVDLRQKAVAA